MRKRLPKVGDVICLERLYKCRSKRLERGDKGVVIFAHTRKARDYRGRFIPAWIEFRLLKDPSATWCLDLKEIKIL